MSGASFYNLYKLSINRIGKGTTLFKQENASKFQLQSESRKRKGLDSLHFKSNTLFKQENASKFQLQSKSRKRKGLDSLHFKSKVL